VAELLLILFKLAEGAHAIAKIVGILKEDPRVAGALAILLTAGIFVAILLRRARREESSILSIRK
jgi:hypothetical protein